LNVETHKDHVMTEAVLPAQTSKCLRQLALGATRP